MRLALLWVGAGMVNPVCPQPGEVVATDISAIRTIRNVVRDE
jgi:hypothetical protein